LRWCALVREDVAAVLRESKRFEDGDLVNRGERGRVMVFSFEEENVRRGKRRERVKRMLG
jgi:hypothetical protein